MIQDTIPISVQAPLVSSTPNVSTELIVAVPVRDEAESIEACLRALSCQVDEVGQPVNPGRYEVILLANNCQDETVEIASRFASQHPDLQLRIVDLDLPEGAHVGHARRLAMDEAARRFQQLHKPVGIIATTDGDSRVGTTWVSATIREVRRGADAVGGRITLDNADLRMLGTSRLRYHLQDVGYRSLVAELESLLDPRPHDPWPRHFQHFGASMAVTVDAYLRSGRLPVRPALEDVAFYNQLVRLDARIRHSPDVQVTTSARQSGRTTFGFAVQLAEWESMERGHQPFLVEQAPAVETSIRNFPSLRCQWLARGGGLNLTEIDRIAARLCVPSRWLAFVTAHADTEGALFQTVEDMQQREGVWRRRWPLVDIRVAIRDLRYRLAMLRPESDRPALLEQVEPVGLLAQTGDTLQAG